MQAQIPLPDGFRFCSANGRQCQETERQEERETSFSYFASSNINRSSRQVWTPGFLPRKHSAIGNYWVVRDVPAGYTDGSSSRSGSSMSASSVAWAPEGPTLEEQKQQWWPPKVLWC